MPERGRIVELVGRLRRIAHSLQFADGLNPAQWEALRYIARANRNSCSPGALAEFMGSTRGTVSQTLKALEAKGLVERRRGAEDRRAVRLAITAAGRAMLENDPLVAFSDALSSCSGDLRASLEDGMERLVHTVQLQQGRPEFGACSECVHFRPELCSATSTVGCRCAISGDVFGAPELDRLCADFARTREAQPLQRLR